MSQDQLNQHVRLGGRRDGDGVLSVGVLVVLCGSPAYDADYTDDGDGEGDGEKF